MRLITLCLQIYYFIRDLACYLIANITFYLLGYRFNRFVRFVSAIVLARRFMMMLFFAVLKRFGQIGSFSPLFHLECPMWMWTLSMKNFDCFAACQTHTHTPYNSLSDSVICQCLSCHLPKKTVPHEAVYGKPNQINAQFK